jgi:hypothetical protein
MRLSLPPERIDVFAPAGCARRDYPTLTDDEFIAEVCRVFTEQSRAMSAGHNSRG